MTETPDNESARRTVREAYGKIAQESSTCCCEPKSSCCGASTPEALARALGYDEGDLRELPQGANLGLSCGNPTAIASLQPGEVVVDLGSGAGFDVFIAARKVGSNGLVIGVDMTPEMVSTARAKAEQFRVCSGLDNIEFRLGEIEHMPVGDATADVVVSNCVINLSQHKPQVWREIARVLKPGGRLAISDIALKRPLPAEVRRSAEALVGCIAGAVTVKETLRMAREAGLANAQAQTQPIYSDDASDWLDTASSAIIDLLPQGTKLSEYVMSMDLSAIKPSGNQH